MSKLCFACVSPLRSSLNSASALSFKSSKTSKMPPLCVL
eukprot:CAMPEP_0176107616 /NCGR_PEP_ID=MMETSP0120_2-20121206/54013_1 /TAXON_ID=160619 /ORGANISM="Kryptoperidinium foliaceum, Strain CCMP 1326" /LENGTH=38 /DNA_ID= /DNA_START= /DNA_END= /DNA_ORIENTATION=